MSAWATEADGRRDGRVNSVQRDLAIFYTPYNDINSTTCNWSCMIRPSIRKFTPRFSSRVDSPANSTISPHEAGVSMLGQDDSASKSLSGDNAHATNGDTTDANRFVDLIAGAADMAGSVAGKVGDAASGVIDAGNSLVDTVVSGQEDSALAKLESDQRPEIAHVAPSPVLDDRERQQLEELGRRYEKLVEPGAIGKLGKKFGSLVPNQLKDAVISAADSVQAQKLYRQAMEYVGTGFKVVEEQAARFSVGKYGVLTDFNKTDAAYKVTSLDEICLLRSYDVAKVADSSKLLHLGGAFAEGAATGLPGFAGIPANLVLSTFLYYRAVQSIAMCYGYDVKSNPAELVIAGEVFTSALSPSDSSSDGIGAAVGKIMMMAEISTTKQVVKKGWTAMAQYGGIPLVITQMRALANGAAKKALAKAGKQGIEGTAFKSVFKQVGASLSQKTVQRAVPVVGGVVGALFDTGQMNKILEYADIFYCKRFILEKDYRIGVLLGDAAVQEVVVDANEE